MKKFVGYIVFLSFFNYAYTMVVNQLPDDYAWLITLLILFIPILLFFAYRDLMISRWNYKLPFGRVVIAGFTIVLLGAVLLATLHWLNERFFHFFGVQKDRSWPKAVWDFVSWYFLFAIIGIPLAYGALRLKLALQKN